MIISHDDAEIKIHSVHVLMLFIHINISVAFEEQRKERRALVSATPAELMWQNSDFAAILNCNSHFGSDYENKQMMCFLMPKLYSFTC